MSTVNVGILTSVDTRHRYFVNALREHANVVAVAYEETGYSPATVDKADLTPQERRVVEAHFAERHRQERLFFGANADFIEGDASCASCRLAPATLNSEATVDFLVSRGVDTVVVYGTSLIQAPLIDRWQGRMINMHLGLSPYYRGTATNFYPLLNEEPEYVGATVHLIDAGIDSGAIFRHARPEIVEEDQPHTIGCKAILAGIDAMVSVLEAFAAGRATPVAQWPVTGARLYLRRDYHPRQVVTLYDKIDAGLIPQYVERATAVRDRMRLIQ